MRLHSFLELFDENTKVKVYQDNNILIESYISDIPQKILNFRYVKNCMIDNSVLIIFTIVKSQEEMDLIEEK